MSSSPARGEITRLLVAWAGGDAASVERLMPLVYDELRLMARMYVRRGDRDRTLQRTALVHEAFLRLVDQRVAWQNRSQFYGLAAQIMRRIAIDDARRRGRLKRGAAAETVPIELIGDVAAGPGTDGVDAILLDRALSALALVDPAAAKIVELRFFAGLTVEETADVLGHSPSTIKRESASAKAWLFRHLTRTPRTAAPRE